MTQLTTQQQKFISAQTEMKKLSQTVPKQFQKWDYVRTLAFKKCIKECDRYTKLNPTDDQSKYIKMENHLTTLRKFYQ